MITRIRVAALVALCLFLAGLSAIAQEGRIVREMVYAPSLEGNLFGDSTKRQVTIYLPPGYDDGDNLAYPVVYLLHGYTGDNDQWTVGSYISGNILNSMNSWLKSGKVKEVILVMPNSHNSFQGSFYTNSTTTGKWGDFIAEDLVQYIDSNYRTLPQRESRGVIGHSMGGYGGMTVGLDYPDVYGCMGSIAGVLDMMQYPTKISSAFAQAAKLKKLSDFSTQSFEVMVSIAMSAAIAPNPDNPPFYADFAWERDDSNKLVNNQEVWNRFMARDVLSRVSANPVSLSSMLAIYIDCGTSDEFGLLMDARRVHEELQRLGIPHEYKESAGSHSSCVMTSTGDALEVFSNAMAFEMLVSVEPAGKLAIPGVR